MVRKEGKMSNRLKRFITTLKLSDRIQTTERIRQESESKRPQKKWLQPDYAVLLVQGPSCLAMHWHIQKETMDMVAMHLNKPWEQVNKLIRLHDVTDMIFNGTFSHKHVEIQLPEMTNNWQFYPLQSERSYIAEYGVASREEQFIPVIRTEAVYTPASKLNFGYTEQLNWKQLNPTVGDWKEHFCSYTFYE